MMPNEWRNKQISESAARLIGDEFYGTMSVIDILSAVYLFFSNEVAILI